MKKLILFVVIALSINVNAQNVYIPNANFKASLVEDPQINTNGDSEIQVSEANAFTGYIGCEANDIDDLTGIEAFTQLTFLDCQDQLLTFLDLSQNTALTHLILDNNQLTSLDVSQNTQLSLLTCGLNQLSSLDVSQNTALTTLWCNVNQLTSLDVTQNTALTSLDCLANQLTSLDVSQNTQLNYLVCGDNQLTSLDVSQNTALTILYCYENQLTSLDVSQNNQLSLFVCFANQLNCLNVKNGNNSNFSYLEAYQNPNLTCIEVDNVSYSTTNWNGTWFTFDAQTSFSEDCGNPCTLGISELKTNTPNQLLKIVDLLGRETPYNPNTVLIYVYNDGTTERVFKFEE